MLWAADPQMLNDHRPLQMKVLCSGAMVILGEATPAVARPILKQALRGSVAVGLNNLRAQGANANKYMIHPESPSAASVAAAAAVNSPSAASSHGVVTDARGRAIPTSRLPQHKDNHGPGHASNHSSSTGSRSRLSGGLPVGTTGALAAAQARREAEASSNGVSTPESKVTHISAPNGITIHAASSPSPMNDDSSPSTTARSSPAHAWGTISVTGNTLTIPGMNTHDNELSPGQTPRGLRVSLPVTPNGTDGGSSLNSMTASDIALASRHVTPMAHNHLHSENSTTTTPAHGDHIIDMTLTVPSGATTLNINTPSHLNNNSSNTPSHSGAITLPAPTPNGASAAAHHRTESGPPMLHRTGSMASVTLSTVVPVPQVLTLRADSVEQLISNASPLHSASTAAANGGNIPSPAARLAGHQRQNSSPRLPKPLLPVTPVRMLLRRGAPSYHALYRSQSNLHQRKDSSPSVSLNSAPGQQATTTSST
jgi:hypothetical protein